MGERGGWENPETVERFVDYAAACFARFGDRVKLWSTLNEPSWSTLNGYLTGIHPPGRQDPRAAIAVSWNLLRAHARVVRAGHEAGRGKSHRHRAQPLADPPGDGLDARIAPRRRSPTAS